MKKYFIIISYSIYLFFILGLLFHTSAHPQMFSKYTIRYFIFLIFLILAFPLFLWLINFLSKRSIVKVKKKKIILTPLIKIISIFLLILFIVVLPIELFLRNKYKDYESTSYTYTIDNFNPFLQSQLGKQENLPVNSLGFRGEEISPIKPKGTYRIFVLGGSTVLDREVPFEKSAVRLLEKKLRERFPQKHIEVINAGKDYYTTEHSLIQYMFKIQDLQPDLIIMWHGTNDIVASCLSEGVVTHGEYKSDYSHLFGAVSSIVYNYFRPAPIIQIKLVSIDFLFKAMKDNLYSDFTQKIQQKSREQMARDYMNNKNTITVHDFPSINAYRRNLMYLIQFAKLHQTPLLLGNQPSLFKENNSLEEVEAIMYPRIACEKDGKFYSLESLRYAQDMFNVETKKIAQDQDVYFVDLDNAVPKSLKYFLDAPHYTEQGNEKVAQALFDSLVGYGMIN